MIQKEEDTNVISMWKPEQKKGEKLNTSLVKVKSLDGRGFPANFAKGGRRGGKGKEDDCK